MDAEAGLVDDSKALMGCGRRKDQFAKSWPMSANALASHVVAGAKSRTREGNMKWGQAH